MKKIKSLLVSILIEVTSISLLCLSYWVILIAWINGIISLKINLDKKEDQDNLDLIGLIVAGYIIFRLFNFLHKNYFIRYDQELVKKLNKYSENENN